MYGNLYVSGLVSSDATASPLPATTVATSTTATTRTHNQPHPHRSFSTVTTAALQNNHPHLAGNEASCHIKDSLFPRNRDGRIVLPHPTTLSVNSHSTRLHRPTASMTNPTPPLSTSTSQPTHRRIQTDTSTGYNHDPNFNEGRRGAGLRTPQIQSDIPEAYYTESELASAIGNTGEPYRSLAIDEYLHTPQMDEFEGRPFSGPSRRTQQSKKHDHKPKRKRPEQWPRTPDNEEFSVQPSHLSQQSSSSQHSSSRSHLELYFDRHGTAAHPRDFLRTPLARELSLQTTNLEAPQSTTPVTTPQTYIGAYGYEHFSPPHQGTFDVSMSSYPETQGHSHKETSRQQRQHHLRHHSASRPESLTDIVQETIKSGSRSKNPQSSDNNPTPARSGERSVNTSPTRERPSSSHLPSQTEEHSGSGSVQTQFRFQEPVVPEADTTSPVHTRDLSIVQVKWDSERKRRQGYFAQEEGAEKSLFRHYNKANCDFEE